LDILVLAKGGDLADYDLAVEKRFFLLNFLEFGFHAMEGTENASVGGLVLKDFVRNIRLALGAS
jgi:hypothetical protein